MSLEAVSEAISNLFQVTGSSLRQIPGLDLVVDYARRSYQNDPFRVFLEALLIFFTARYLFSKPEKGPVKLSDREIDQLIEEWEPEPLVPRELEPSLDTPVGESAAGLRVTLKNGAQYQNWSSTNFVNVHNLPEIMQKAITAVRGYGVGACGPAGFYGSLDIHMELEQKLAKTLDVEEAIIYSQGFMAVASVIPAFAKRGDIIVVDKAASLAIQTGTTISKSHIYYYEHNDMEDLERVLQDVDQEAARKKWSLTRRFIITEGLFWKTGRMAALPQILELKRKYKYRLVLDESLSFGCLGPRGLGLTDHFGIPAKEVDIIAGSFSNVLGSSGGFCAGTREVIDHQRLSSQAYCFSAALPALLAVTASEAISRIVSCPEMLQKLRENANAFYDITHGKLPSRFCVVGDRGSPLLHVQLARRHEDPRYEHTLIERIVHDLRNKGYLTCKARYVEEKEAFPQPPSIRIGLSAGFTVEETETFARALLDVLRDVKHT